MAKKKTIGERIREAFMNQKKLAKLTGIDEIRMSRGLNGEIEFTKEEIHNIECALNIRLYTESIK